MLFLAVLEDEFTVLLRGFRLEPAVVANIPALFLHNLDGQEYTEIDEAVNHTKAHELI